MLRALRRLLRPGGRMAFTTIYVPPGLGARERRRAQRAGPRAVASRSDHLQLLRSAGFGNVESVDLTEEFATTARAWLAACEEHRTELREVESPEVFDQRQRERRAQLRAIEDGLLRRSLFIATRVG